MSTLDAGPAPLVSASPHIARGYRYPGSPPFGDSELDRLVFRGRAVEADAVLHSILSHDLFVVFGRSGMGKTSLLSAGVFESLRARDLWPFVVRVNDPEARPIDLVRSSLLAAAEADEEVDLTQHPAADGSTPETLWDLFSVLEVWRGNVLERPVMILDQFEELFTLGFPDQVRHDFIVQLGELVRRHRAPDHRTIDVDARRLPDPDMKVVMVLREDSLGELDAMSTHVPQIMRHRFRVRGLRPDQARAAIIDPATTDDPRLRSHRFTYSEDAADLLLEFLRTREVRGETHLAPRVDPSQLQIICQHVERFIVPHKTEPGDAGDTVEITPEDLGGTQGLNDILRDFYQREIAALDPEDQPKARALCEAGLISRSGRRLSLEEGEIEATWGVSRELLDELIDRRLLRADPRVGSVYYELAHDTLVSGIQDQSREWLTAEQALRRAVWLDRWSLGLTIPNLLYGWLSGPLLAVSILALRSPPQPRRRQWRAWLGLGVGLAWYAIWATPWLWAGVTPFDDPSAGQPWLDRWFFFGIFSVQAAIGTAVGLLWPVNADRTSSRWKWVLGGVTAALLVSAVVSILIVGAPDKNATAGTADTAGFQTEVLQIRPTVVSEESIDAGTVSFDIGAQSLVRHELRVEDRRPIAIDVRGSEGLDPVVRVIAGTARPASGDIANEGQLELGEDDDGGDGLDARLEFALAPGPYTIEVYAFNGAADQATIEVTTWDAILVADDTFTNQQIGVEVPADDSARQDLVVTARRRIVIDVGGSDGMAVGVDVFDGDDLVVGSTDAGEGGDARLEIELEPGTYTIEVSDFEGTGGQAVINVRALDAIVVAEGSITGVPVELDIPKSASARHFLTVTDRRRIFIDVRGSAGTDPVVRVLGDEVTLDDRGGDGPHAWLGLELEPGSYIIEVSDANDAAGQATVEVTPGDAIVVSDDSITGVPIELDIPSFGESELVLRVTDRRWIAVDVTASDGMALGVDVLDGEEWIGGSFLDGHEFEGADGGARVPLELDPGLYTIIVFDAAGTAGRATIDVTAFEGEPILGPSVSIVGDDPLIDPPEPGDSIEIDTEATGSIEPGGEVDWFVHEHEGGRFEAVTSGCDDGDDTVLILWEVDQTTVRERNDDAADRGLCSAIVVQDLPAGTYHLTVQPYWPDGPLQDYTLTIGGG